VSFYVRSTISNQFLISKKVILSVNYKPVCVLEKSKYATMNSAFRSFLTTFDLKLAAQLRHGNTEPVADRFHGAEPGAINVFSRHTQKTAKIRACPRCRVADFFISFARCRCFPFLPTTKQLQPLTPLQRQPKPRTRIRLTP
jgi:hypothetical protein